ncbi:HlyD family secretion protein [Labrys okinawensis]|uniref:HlyD family secretion protein n=1 Tax=Labrys okinawensis TaxID=346911 RepID=UPI0039BD21FD
MVEMPRIESFQQVVERKEVEVPAAVAVKAPSSRRKLIKRLGLAAALLAATAFAGDYGYTYWTVGQYLESTDDAYVKADYTTIAPKVSGYIADVLVQDNEKVKAGQVLARIDDRDFKAALAQSQADVEAANAAIGNIDAQIGLQYSLVAQAQASVAATEASLKFARADADRYSDLIKTGAGTLQRAQQTEAARDSAAAQLQSQQAAVLATRAKLDVLATARKQAEAQRDRSLAAAHQAELNLSYTSIIAPVDGIVGARSLRIGQYVSAGTQLMAVVPLHAVYVVANFKETQLTNVRDGQPVEVSVDGFPGVHIQGRVDSISPASGLEFALLPPDNATGNFTKIVQRIPVKITFDDSALSGLLRSGMSVEPTIDSRSMALVGSSSQGE